MFLFFGPQLNSTINKKFLQNKNFIFPTKIFVLRNLQKLVRCDRKKIITRKRCNINRHLQQQNALLGPTQYSSILYTMRKVYTRAIATANRNSFTSADGKGKKWYTNVLSIFLIYITATLYNIHMPIDAKRIVQISSLHKF